MQIIASLSLLALVAAQSPQVIQVGSTSDAPGGIFQFIPPTVNAQNGETVTFRFISPGNHSITQSTFGNPCNPVAGGFDSGNVLIPVGNVEAPEWNLVITDATKPIWFYCKQFNPAVHCAKGMVGAINAPTSGNTFPLFQAAAEKFSGTSGQREGGLVGLGASASAFPSPIAGNVSLFTAAAATGSGAAPAPSSPSYPGGGSGTSPSASPLGSPSASPNTSSSASPTASSGTPGATNSTSAALVMSVNTFLVFSAAALGVAFT